MVRRLEIISIHIPFASIHLLSGTSLALLIGYHCAVGFEPVEPKRRYVTEEPTLQELFDALREPCFWLFPRIEGNTQENPIKSPYVNIFDAAFHWFPVTIQQNKTT